MFNRARGLTGIWALDRSSIYSWRRKANDAFQKDKTLQAPRQTPTLDITPYVQAYCNTQTRSRPREMVDMAMSRLVLSVEQHPVGDDAGYFTTMAKHAKLHGDLNGKLLVKHISAPDSEDDEASDGEDGRNDENVNKDQGREDGMNDENVNKHQGKETDEIYDDSDIAWPTGWF